VGFFLTHFWAALHFIVFRMPDDFFMQGGTLRIGCLCLSNNIILVVVIIVFCLLIYYKTRHIPYVNVSEFKQGLLRVSCEKTNVFSR